MKNIRRKLHFILPLAAIAWLMSCKTAPDYREARQEVMDLHDKLMIDGEIAFKNKMRLDTLVKQGLKKLKLNDPTLDTVKEKQKIYQLIGKLNSADDMMMDWMHRFQADVEGKSNEQAVTYFNAEKLKLNSLDSIYSIALKQSDSYLKQFKID